LTSVGAQTHTKALREIDVAREAVNRGAQPPHNGAIVEPAARLEIQNATQCGELKRLGSVLSRQG
jgi:hypothetical protein